MSEEYYYINNRLNPQMDHYRNTAKKLDKADKQLTIASIVIAALIPVAAIFALLFGNFVVVVIAILGAFSCIATGVRMYLKYHERAVQFRTVFELLDSELAKYKEGVFYYNITDEKKKMEILVSFCESTMRDQNASWEELMSEK